MEIESIRKEAYAKVFEIMSIITSSIDINSLNLEYIQYRIKTKDSIIKKMEKVGNNIYDVYDLIGIKYVFQDLSIVDTFCKNIKSIKDFNIVEIKDYLKKIHPRDPNYNALHILLTYDNFPCEIEIMDTNMSKHIIMSHDDFKKGLLK